jgi:nickel-dependent lactate racemase
MQGMGFADRFLTEDETRDIVRAGLASLPLANKRVLFIIPDGTRTMPMPQFFALFREMLDGKVAALDFLVALGTHPPMDDAALSRLVGEPVVNGRAGNSSIFNHEWADPATFAETLAVTCRQRGVPPPAVTAAQIATVRTALREFGAAWRPLVPGQALDRRF